MVVACWSWRALGTPPAAIVVDSAVVERAGGTASRDDRWTGRTEHL